MTKNRKTVRTKLRQVRGDKHASRMSRVLRVALSGRTNTPDLYSIMQVMGGPRVIKRIKDAI